MERHSRMEMLGPLHDHRYRRCRFHSPHPIRRTQSGQTDFTHRCGCEQPARGAAFSPQTSRCHVQTDHRPTPWQGVSHFSGLLGKECFGFVW